MADVSITLAEVSMIFGRTVMADVSFGRSVNWPMCRLANQSDIQSSNHGHIFTAFTRQFIYTNLLVYC